MEYTLPALPYAYDALEPYIDKETMRLHHDKHHQTYIDNANAMIKTLPEKLKKLSANQLLMQLDEIPEDKLTGIKNNVGGHVNHSLFWDLLKTGTKLEGSLKAIIEQQFSSIDLFKKQFSQAALSRFGSGWAWLVVDKGKLAITSTANQDTPIMGEKFANTSGTPILGIDVWEHAYYLKYQNRRLDYINAFWDVINWEKVTELFNHHK